MFNLNRPASYSIFKYNVSVNRCQWLAFKIGWYWSDWERDNLLYFVMLGVVVAHWKDNMICASILFLLEGVGWVHLLCKAVLRNVSYFTINKLMQWASKVNFPSYLPHLNKQWIENAQVKAKGSMRTKCLISQLWQFLTKHCLPVPRSFGSQVFW